MPLRCGQRIAGIARWLDIHWRAAKVICLDFRGYPEQEIWKTIQPASFATAGCARVLRVTCSFARPHDPRLAAYAAEASMSLGLPGWVAGIAPLCPNLVALHLKRIEVMQIPVLRLLKHLILEECVFRPALVASLQGLASLETLLVSGYGDAKPPGWDLRACTRLRRVHMCLGLAGGQAEAGQELCLPPACTVSLDILQSEQWRGWLARLGPRLVDLRLHCSAGHLVAPHSTFMHGPQLSQLRHVTLIVTCKADPGTLRLARLLGGLPQCVDSLHLDAPYMLSEEELVVVPASLRAVRIRGVCEGCACSRAGCCPLAERAQDLAFGLHAGLERLQLVLWGARVGLQCLVRARTACRS